MHPSKRAKTAPSSSVTTSDKEGEHDLRVLLVTSEAGGVPLMIQQEKQTISAAVGATNLRLIERAKLIDLVRGLPEHGDCSVVHFSCHGSLDFKLKELVRARCSGRGIAVPPDEELSRLCAGAIRRALAEPPLSDPVPLPLLAPDVLEKGMLEGMEAGVVLHHHDHPESGYEIVKPDGLAGLFGVCQALECVVLNACTSHLQGKEFLMQTSHIKYVISVRGRISDEAALWFSEGFYSALKSHPVEDAFTHGCFALKAKYGAATRERMVEDDGGVPKLHPRPAPEAPPSVERFRFQVDARIPRADVDTKDALVSYLLGALTECGVPVRAGDIHVSELTVTWQIVLHERDDFAISKSEGERLTERLNDMYDLQAPARVRFGGICSGSVVLTLHSSADVHAVIASDARSGSPKCAVLDGMRLKEVRPLGCSADVIGSGSAYARLCACASTLGLPSPPLFDFHMCMSTSPPLRGSVLKFYGFVSRIFFSEKRSDPERYETAPTSETAGSVPSGVPFSRAADHVKKGDLSSPPF